VTGWVVGTQVYTCMYLIDCVHVTKLRAPDRQSIPHPTQPRGLNVYMHPPNPKIGTTSTAPSSAWASTRTTCNSWAASSSPCSAELGGLSLRSLWGEERRKVVVVVVVVALVEGSGRAPPEWGGIGRLGEEGGGGSIWLWWRGGGDGDLVEHPWGFWGCEIWF
jgi:hypothetical protein